MWLKNFALRRSAMALGAALLLGGAVFSQRDALFAAPNLKIENPHAEPPAEYILNINGKPVSLALDKEIRARVGNRSTRLKLSRKPTRVFDKAGVRFSYPVGFVFQADTSDPELLIWKMTGSDSLIMLQKYEPMFESLVMSIVVHEVTKDFGRQNVRVVPTTLTLRGRKLQGKKLLIKDSPTQEFFTFSNESATFLLVIQDNLSLENKPTTEAAKVRNLLTSTLSIR